eukprot:TRINITY_DN9863_c1_g2_i1.p1 TRINITY_DN9863_c1_g2~~TRINITY_DN9863_c1_g2_i1.p1  ORF type:complete len:158 (-),score=4.93 TRINITY_DN9863_c1_g2_i1:10-483(-)
MSWLSDTCTTCARYETTTTTFYQLITNITSHDILQHIIVQQLVSLEYLCWVLAWVLEQSYKEEQQKVGSQFALQQQLQDEIKQAYNETTSFISFSFCCHSLLFYIIVYRGCILKFKNNCTVKLPIISRKIDFVKKLKFWDLCYKIQFNSRLQFTKKK